MKRRDFILTAILLACGKAGLRLSFTRKQIFTGIVDGWATYRPDNRVLCHVGFGSFRNLITFRYQ